MNNSLAVRTAARKAARATSGSVTPYEAVTETPDLIFLSAAEYAAMQAGQRADLQEFSRLGATFDLDGARYIRNSATGLLVAQRSFADELTAAQVAALVAMSTNWIMVEGFGASASASAAVNRAAFQQALDQPGGKFVSLFTAGEYLVDDHLLVGDYTSIALGPGVSIKKANGLLNNVCLLRNRDLINGNVGIELRGGKFDGNYINQTGLVASDKTGALQGVQGELSFVKVKGLKIERVTPTNSNGFAVQIAGCDGFAVNDLNFGTYTNRDGLHVNGPCNGFDIQNVQGRTKDDLIALNAWDWRISAPSVGDIKNGQIRNIVANDSVTSGASTTAALIKFLAGTRDGVQANVKNIDVSGVKGAASGSAAFWISTDTDAGTTEPSGVGYVDGISIRDVKGVRMYNSQPLLYVNQSIGSVSLDGVDGEAAFGLVKMGSNLVGQKISINGYEMKAGADQQIQAYGGTLQELSITNSTFIGVNDGSNPTGNDAGIVDLNGGGISSINLRGVRQRFGGSYVYARSTASIAPRIRTSGCTFENIKHHIFAQKSVDSESVGDTFVGVRNSLIRNDTVSSVASWIGGSAGYTGGVPLANVNSGTLRVKRSDIPVDLSIITLKLAGDMVNNSNAGLSCGAGPAVSNGTLWKGVYSGATY